MTVAFSHLVPCLPRRNLFSVSHIEKLCPRPHPLFLAQSTHSNQTLKIFASGEPILPPRSHHHHFPFSTRKPPSLPLGLTSFSGSCPLLSTPNWAHPPPPRQAERSRGSKKFSSKHSQPSRRLLFRCSSAQILAGTNKTNTQA